MVTPVTPQRIQQINQAPVNPSGEYVLYWMTADRRKSYNAGLQRAVAWAEELNRPLLVLEGLRLDYPLASRRLHAFILQGMADNKEAFSTERVFYYPFVETKKGRGKGLLASLSKRACMVVADVFPCFFLPRMLKAAGRKLKVGLEGVDSCTLMPLGLPGRDFPTAYGYRRFWQKNLPDQLSLQPVPDPLQGTELPILADLPPEIKDKWPQASKEALEAGDSFLSGLDLDQKIKEVLLKGGAKEAGRALRRFIDQGLDRYDTEARQPSSGAFSGLSPYLHFGHIAPQEIFHAVVNKEAWLPSGLIAPSKGQREGWWGMSPGAEAFLDQLITWRELGYMFSHYRTDYASYESLPDWAQTTLAQHAGDPRPHLYNIEELWQARTHDPIWNAAQTQLLKDGVIHNYLRMLWGKKILKWSPTPKQAFLVMKELNDRLALDGRDPNSYSGICWVLGRHDRAWGPERPIFGKVRYMTSESTARKLKLKEYLAAYGQTGGQAGLPF
ncbi:deoxyribodipyrimidine photo-lyase [Dethiosulfatarculus sandiegensis]|uniref:Deoxyribodipyrimidine photo-lyase n=1 Tax=Dethiosulfatarculus sandiegensis TaxID=1429043 RepID=A0A0D2JN83_9BACT|nr:deoxyribodipyrimidine photo-lyase [Dethiosulfatarculus sandiegensis]KIX10950.1 deoxyribodipyrimidine photo-lyase [Dethiosulfatarculus sandiegensis]